MSSVQSSQVVVNLLRVLFIFELRRFTKKLPIENLRGGFIECSLRFSLFQRFEQLIYGEGKLMENVMNHDGIQIWVRILELLWPKQLQNEALVV